MRRLPDFNLLGEKAHQGRAVRPADALNE